MYRDLVSSLFSGLLISSLFIANTAQAIDVDATAIALRMSNTITGGMLPTSDPLFAQIETREEVIVELSLVKRILAEVNFFSNKDAVVQEDLIRLVINGHHAEAGMIVILFNHLPPIGHLDCGPPVP